MVLRAGPMEQISKEIKTCIGANLNPRMFSPLQVYSTVSPNKPGAVKCWKAGAENASESLRVVVIVLPSGNVNADIEICLDVNVKRCCHAALLDSTRLI